MKTSQATEPLAEPTEDVLLHSNLHKIMVIFHKPADWPVARVFAAALLPPILTGLWWWLLADAPAAVTAGVALGLFMLADGWLLWSLPRWGLSFGPWQAQLFALAVPRVAASLIIGMVTWFLAPDWALGLLLFVQLLATVALLWGTLVEPFRLQLTHLPLAVDSPLHGRPVRILHISDLHIERLTRREQKLLALAQEAAADVILITGDYLNLSYVRDPEAQAHVIRLLDKLSAPYGVYAILGSPPVDERDVVPPLFDDLPVRLLKDEWLDLELDDGRRLILLGMDCTHYLPLDRRRLARLAQSAPNSAPRILLYHAPDLMPEAAALGLDLYLCGHTHGGQVRLPGFGAILTSSQLGKRYEMGLYREDRTHLYVSRGVGLEGLSAPRVRFLSPPEITLISLSGGPEIAAGDGRDPAGPK
jgi:uncharacterized protein